MIINLFFIIISRKQILIKPSESYLHLQHKFKSNEAKNKALKSSSKVIKDYRGSCGTYSAYYFTEKTNTLSISGSKKMFDYGPGSGRSQPWSSFVGSIVSIKVVKSVTSISNYAFSNCYNATNVEIGETVTTIGEYAFKYCYKLAYITIPSSITSIGKGCFSYCDGLKKIDLPSSVTGLSSNTFEYCISLYEATIRSSVTEIPNHFFYDCRSLSTFTHT